MSSRPNAISCTIIKRRHMTLCLWHRHKQQTRIIIRFLFRVSTNIAPQSGLLANFCQTVAFEREPVEVTRPTKSRRYKLYGAPGGLRCHNFSIATAMVMASKSDMMIRHHSIFID